MYVETFKDVIEWTQGLHANLADCLAHCANETDSERVRMLVGYLGSHESELVRVLELSEEDAASAALDTWVYDYVDNAPVKPRKACDESFRGKSADEVLSEVMKYHEQIIELYKYMQGRAEVATVKSLIDNLLELEQQQARLMTTQANRLADL